MMDVSQGGSRTAPQRSPNEMNEPLPTLTQENSALEEGFKIKSVA